MKKNTIFTLLAVAFATLLTGCNSCTSSTTHKASISPTLITIDGTQLIKNGKPYHFMGCNIWYASVLGSTGQGGDRARLCRELDTLKALGVTNVRILSGPDAGSDLANPAKP